jgi:hypothetical protein
MKVDTIDIIMTLGVPYLIGGSYVVSPVHANDLDICVHEYNYDDKFRDRLYAKGFFALSQGDEKYDEIDHMRIIDIYEGVVKGEKWNIIVVGAVFWPAYVGAVNTMTSDPHLYMQRDQRVALHRALSREVAAIARVELPEGAA